MNYNTRHHGRSNIYIYFQETICFEILTSEGTYNNTDCSLTSCLLNDPGPLFNVGNQLEHRVSKSIITSQEPAHQ